MKYNRMIICLLSAMALLSACQYNRPDEPTPRGNEQKQMLQPTHTIAQLKALYSGRATYITEDVVVEATMASDDTEGNLYRTCYIQDETGGIELKLSLGNMSTLYPQGSKVYLKAKDMTLGLYADQINLGYRSTDPKYETSFYPEKLVPEVLLPAGKGSITPHLLGLSQVSKRYAGTLVRIDDVQFAESELGQTYAAPTNKKAQGNVNRTLVDRSGKTLIVRTSSYARFAGREIPKGSGSITAILSYFRDTPQLLLLRESDAQMTKPRF